MTGASVAYTDQDYENYLNEPRRIYNEMLRDKGQSFSDAMCEGSIVAGLENGEEILDMIRKAGN